MSLSINLSYQNGLIGDVTTTMERPGTALGQWLQQQPEQEALAALPVIFSVCGRSHDVAARLALGLLKDTEEARRQAHRAVLESIREYLIRLLQHWHYPLDRARLGQWMQAVNSDTDSPAVLAAGARDLMPDRQQTTAWLQQLEKNWQQTLANTHIDFNHCAQQAGGQPLHYDEWSPENSGFTQTFFAGGGAQVLAHNKGPLIPLLSQVIDRMLTDLTYLTGRLTGELTGYALIQHCLREDRHGSHSEGWVRTSRGWLCHRISTTREGRQWQVIAPTDINFSLTGSLLCTGLQGQHIPEDELVAAVAAIVKAIDPCVAFTLLINGQTAETENSDPGTDNQHA
ncbi:MAG: hypothetical protein CMI02_16455 [Oceanospirillaceae bacterium]|nr:hypothetical protein [Oceanospirillaceae bacterium]MBT13613.1 hypothetical protein [Oceanospirillaceae bacterium]|tara:strand:+ start:14298 stop:15323 length:1026 start_codon:yes stop_codon:yes gene_type:complete